MCSEMCIRDSPHSLRWRSSHFSPGRLLRAARPVTAKSFRRPGIFCRSGFSAELAYHGGLILSPRHLRSQTPLVHPGRLRPRKCLDCCGHWLFYYIQCISLLSRHHPRLPVSFGDTRSDCCLCPLGRSEFADAAHLVPYGLPRLVSERTGIGKHHVLSPAPYNCRSAQTDTGSGPDLVLRIFRLQICLMPSGLL